MRHDHHQGTNTTSPTNSQHTTKQTHIHKISHSQTPKPTAKRRNHTQKPMPETKTQPQTQIHAARNTNSKHKQVRNTKPKHKHSLKHKTETSKIENRGRNGLGRWPNVGRRRRICGGWARADQRWVSEEERRVCGSMEEERRDGEAVRRERQRKDNEGKNKK